jgi:hypothetical protein
MWEIDLWKKPEAENLVSDSHVIRVPLACYYFSCCAFLKRFTCKGKEVTLLRLFREGTQCCVYFYSMWNPSTSWRFWDEGKECKWKAVKTNCLFTSYMGRHTPEFRRKKSDFKEQTGNYVWHVNFLSYCLNGCRSYTTCTLYNFCTRSYSSNINEHTSLCESIAPHWFSQLLCTSLYLSIYHLFRYLRCIWLWLPRESVLRIINLTVAKDWFCPRIYRLPAIIFLPCLALKPRCRNLESICRWRCFDLPYVDLLLKSKHMYVYITTYSLLIYTLVSFMHCQYCTYTYIYIIHQFTRNVYCST